MIDRKLQEQHDTVVIMAPGPSLTHQQVHDVAVKNIHTICIGDAGRVYYPRSPVLYHCDHRWWEYYMGCEQSSGIKVSLEWTRHTNSMTRSLLTEGLDLEFPNLVAGTNSGYQAINLAVYCNPKKIILIGYDMKTKDGQHNIIGDHPKQIKRRSDFSLFAQNIDSLAPTLDNLGIKVYNCTLDSALQAFEKRDLNDVI